MNLHLTLFTSNRDKFARSAAPRWYWWMVCLAAIAIVGFGYSAGDLNAVEATHQLSAKHFRSNPSMEGWPSSEQTNFGYGLALIQQWLEMEVTPESSKAIALAALVGSGLILGVWIARSVGLVAAWITLAMFLLSPAAILLSTRSLPDSTVVLLAVVLLALFAVVINATRSAVRLAAATLILICQLLLTLVIDTSDFSGWASEPADRFVSPLYSLLIAAPVLALAIPAIMPTTWKPRPTNADSVRLGNRCDGSGDGRELAYAGVLAGLRTLHCGGRVALEPAWRGSGGSPMRCRRQRGGFKPA